MPMSSSKRRQLDRRERQNDKTGKTRSDRQRVEEKRESILEEEEAALAAHSRRRNTRLASGSIKQVDYKFSASGALARPFGESDDDSAGREQLSKAAGSGDAIDVELKREPEREISPSDAMVEGARTTRRQRNSRTRRTLRQDTDDDGKVDSHTENDENEVPDTIGEDKAKEDVDMAEESPSNANDDAGLLDLDADGGDSEEHSEGYDARKGCVARLDEKRLVIAAIKRARSADAAAIVEAAGDEITAGNVESLLDETKERMKSVELAPEDASPSPNAIVAFLSAEVYQCEKRNQESNIKRSKSELDMERHADKLVVALDQARNERLEAEWLTKKRKGQLDEIKNQSEVEIRRKRQLEKEKGGLENEVKEARTSAEQESKQRKTLEAENEALKIKELEARRRLDRANLKIIALRGEYTAETVDQLMNGGASRTDGSGSDDDDDEADFSVLTVKRKSLEMSVNRKEIDMMKWLRRVEVQRRKNNQLLDVKNRLESELYLSNLKVPSAPPAAEAAAPKKADKKAKPLGKEEPAKKDRGGGKASHGQDPHRDATAGKKHVYRANTNPANASAEAGTNARDAVTAVTGAAEATAVLAATAATAAAAATAASDAAPEAPVSKRKARPMQSLA